MKKIMVDKPKIHSIEKNMPSQTCSMLISNGPRDWHSGQEPGLTS